MFYSSLLIMFMLGYFSELPNFIRSNAAVFFFYRRWSLCSTRQQVEANSNCLLPSLGSFLGNKESSSVSTFQSQAIPTVSCVFAYQDSVEYCIIGVTILSQLTNEINQVSATAFFIEVSDTFFS